MNQGFAAPGTRPRKRRRPVLALCCALLALVPALCAHAQVDRRAFSAQSLGSQLFGAEKVGVEHTLRGPLLKGRHCAGATSRVTTQMRFRVGVVAEDQLLELFDRILCAEPNANGEVVMAALGDAVADPFATGGVSYAGQAELGDWEPQLAYRDPRASASVSLVGLLLGQPGVSLWEVAANDRVRVWYAPFHFGPEKALTFYFEFRGGHWVWTAAATSTRR